MRYFLAFVVGALLYLGVKRLLAQSPDFSNPNHQSWIGFNSGVTAAITANRTEELPWKMLVTVTRHNAEPDETPLRVLTVYQQCDKRYSSGDLNRDGKVNEMDMHLFMLCKGLTEPDSNCTAAIFSCSDHNNNHRVDDEDWGWMRGVTGP